MIEVDTLSCQSAGMYARRIKDGFMAARFHVGVLCVLSTDVPAKQPGKHTEYNAITNTRLKEHFV